LPAMKRPTPWRQCWRSPLRPPAEPAGPGKTCAPRRDLGSESQDGYAEQLRGYRQGLKEAGYTGGENVAIEYSVCDDAKAVVLDLMHPTGGRWASQRAKAGLDEPGTEQHSRDRTGPYYLGSTVDSDQAETVDSTRGKSPSRLDGGVRP
jgi:hypothetical protein